MNKHVMVAGLSLFAGCRDREAPVGSTRGSAPAPVASGPPPRPLPTPDRPVPADAALARAPTRPILDTDGLRGVDATTEEGIRAQLAGFEVKRVPFPGRDEGDVRLAISYGGTPAGEVWLNGMDGHVGSVELTSAAIQTDHGLAVGSPYEQLAAAGKLECWLVEEEDSVFDYPKDAVHCMVGASQLRYELAARGRKPTPKNLAGQPIRRIYLPGL